MGGGGDDEDGAPVLLGRARAGAEQFLSTGGETNPVRRRLIGGVASLGAMSFLSGSTRRGNSREASGPASDAQEPDTDDDEEIEVAVFATEDVVDPAPAVSAVIAEDIDPREIANAQLDPALQSLAAASGRDLSVTVRVVDDPVELEGDGTPFEEWSERVERSQEGNDDLEVAKDSNLLLTDGRPALLGIGRGERPECHLDGEDCEEEVKEDAAVVGHALDLYLPFVPDRLREAFENVKPGVTEEAVEASPEDADIEGRFKGRPEGDPDLSAVAPHTADQLDPQFDARPEDPDGSGVGSSDFVPELFYPATSRFGELQQLVVHEVGHNLGLRHDMGEAREFGDDRILNTAMLGNYYDNQGLPPFQGEENRASVEIEPREGRPVYRYCGFSHSIHENVDQWLRINSVDRHPEAEGESAAESGGLANGIERPDTPGSDEISRRDDPESGAQV